MDCLSSTLEGGNNRKQVRFVSPLINHRQTSLLSPPPTPRLSPVLTPPQSPPLTLNTVNRKSLINNNSVHQRHLIPSRSLTNSPKRILQKENSMEGHIEEKTQIRRMSLKEFSGLDLLEEHANQKAASNLSPMLHPWRSGQQLTLGSLIDKFSNRRRSSSSGGAKIEASLQHSHSEDGYNSFDRALDLINQAIRETINAGNAEQNSTNGSIEKNGKQASNHLEKQYSSTGRNTFGQTLQRLTNIRNHLNSTLQSVPNASPRKATSLEPDCEKLVLLNECKILKFSCKDMIRNSNTSSPPTSQTSDLSLLQNCSNDCHMSNKKYIFILFFKVVQIVVDSAERAIDSVEMLIRKSNSIFQAQQLTSNADQLLKALAEVVREVEKCQKLSNRMNKLSNLPVSGFFN
ncbi:hypothetical protein Mgra_00001717 [Meloidogyne graminicola]|uniref:Uncharacterized protein n=1 Tax=Meloidogyne graminicola TaxID=189291 RepID=A0A8S9ZZ37_9BILA|nr:hypothetical protein Mgra_00001717 [Meloidogyne graminicola]